MVICWLYNSSEISPLQKNEDIIFFLFRYILFEVIHKINFIEEKKSLGNFKRTNIISCILA